MLCFVGLRLEDSVTPWAGQILILPFILLYFITPYLGLAAALCATYYLAIRVVALSSHVGGWIGFTMASVIAIASVGITIVFYKWQLGPAAQARREHPSATKR